MKHPDFKSAAGAVPCYADFYVEADSEKAAEKLIQEKLESGEFSGVAGRPCWENAGENERVFVSGKVARDDDAGVSLDELTEIQNPSQWRRQCRAYRALAPAVFVLDK